MTQLNSPAKDTALKDVPVRRIIRAIAGAAGRWADADFPPRVRILDKIAVRTGYSIPVIEYALDRLFGSITESSLGAVIANELGSLDALDRFQERDMLPAARALPVGRVAVISSRTTIGIAIVPAIFALCAKNSVTVKDREDLLVAAFFKTLVEEDDAFASAAKAKAWESTESPLEVASFHCVVAFGRNETLTEIHHACGSEIRFVGFGSKASVGYIGRESLSDDRYAHTIADELARDLVLYESEGCLSLHALFIENGGEVLPKQFLEHFTTAIKKAHVEFPIGTRNPETTARLIALRDLIEFRSATGSHLYSTFTDKPLSHFLVLDPPRSEPPFFLPCAILVFSVNEPAEALEYLTMQDISLEALATDSDVRPDIAELAVQSGASRIARFGELQSPLLEANHGGRQRITEYIRWITNET